MRARYCAIQLNDGWQVVDTGYPVGSMMYYRTNQPVPFPCRQAAECEAHRLEAKENAGVSVKIHTTVGAWVDVRNIEIPDLWHIAAKLPDDERQMVLDTWHLAHDLLTHLLPDE